MFYRGWLRSAIFRNGLPTLTFMSRHSSTKVQAVPKPHHIQSEAATDAIQKLEKDSARMLNVVKKKVLTRAAALSLVRCCLASCE